MKSDNLLNDIIDKDNIILHLPSPNLTLGIDTVTNVLVLSGNFRMSQQISKIAYLGSSKNTVQPFTLSEIFINFSINDGENSIDYSSRYVPITIISSTCLFIISNKYDIPINFNLINFNVNSFKIIANYIYGNNKLSSLILLKNKNILINYPIIVHIKANEESEESEESDEFTNVTELYKSNNNINEHYMEHIDNPNKKNAYAKLYLLIPLSIIICIGVYYRKSL